MRGWGVKRTNVFMRCFNHDSKAGSCHLCCAPFRAGKSGAAAARNKSPQGDRRGSFELHHLANKPDNERAWLLATLSIRHRQARTPWYHDVVILCGLLGKTYMHGRGGAGGGNRFMALYRVNN